MIRTLARSLATLAVGAVFVASPAFAVAVSWDVNPTQSSFKLTLPDQPITLGTLTATMRLRNQNNANPWTQNNAPVDGFLATNVGAGNSSVEFLTGASSLVGVTTGSYRPNPAAYNTASTDATNTAGQFQNTSSAAGVFAARVNAFLLLNINAGYISFTNVTYDVASGVLPVIATSFVASTTTLGVQNSTINFDSTSPGTTGIPDTIASSGPITALNSLATPGSLVACPIITGSCLSAGVNVYKITVPVNLPVSVSLSGVNLVGTASGSIVGYATIIPEPATLLIVATGLVGLAIAGRRRSS